MQIQFGNARIEASGAYVYIKAFGREVFVKRGRVSFDAAREMSCLNRKAGELGDGFLRSNVSSTPPRYLRRG